jgi:hypothetical protein
VKILVQQTVAEEMKIKEILGQSASEELNGAD